MPVPLAVPAVNVRAVPVQIVFVDAVRPDIVGRAITVTEEDVTTVLLMQPVPL